MLSSTTIRASFLEDVGDGLASGAKDVGGFLAEGWDSTAGAVGGAISFASDPLGAIFQATRDGAEGLATELLPALVHATEPDLSADFFIRAYAISFAAAIMLWGILLIGQFVDLARNKIAGQDFIDNVFLNSSILFGGALFGPWVGVFLVKFFGSMSQALIEWGVGASSDRMLETLTEMLDKDPAAIPGGVIVGILLMVCMIVGFLLVLLMLVVMLVTLYMSGAVMPLGLVWIASNRHHAMAWKIPTLWLGLLAAHPLLFFLMGFAFTMIASTAAWMKWEDGLVTLMNLIAAVVAMAIAGMSPVLLMKFAPILPSGVGQQAGPNLSAPSKSTPNEGTKPGPPQQVDSLGAAKASSRNAVSTSASSSAEPAEQAGGGTGADEKPGALVNHLRELKANKGASGMTGGPAETTGKESSSSAVAPKPGESGVPKPAPASGAGSTSGAGSAGAGAAAGSGGGASSMAGAGAAESSTGVGAVVGIPTLLAARGGDRGGEGQGARRGGSADERGRRAIRGR